MSKQTISIITEKVLEGMAAWQNRPLDAVYPVIFIDAVNVKIRDGQVANRPVYVALAVTGDGTRDILGLWVMSLDPTGTGRQRWSNSWKAALNAFEITFGGRLSAEGRK